MPREPKLSHQNRDNERTNSRFFYASLTLRKPWIWFLIKCHHDQWQIWALHLSWHLMVWKTVHNSFTFMQQNIFAGVTWQPALISQRRSPLPHSWGYAPSGGYDPTFKLGRDLCTMHLPPRFIIPRLLIWKLSCSQTNIQTHKQTDAAENIPCSSLLYDVG